MKTRILTLLMMLFVFAWSAKADEITGMTLTISHNYGPFFEVAFPAEGWPDLDLTDESSTSIRIKRIEVQTSGTVSDVVFKATMYKTENGLQPDDGWRIFELPQQGNTWVLDFGDEAKDLIDDEMKASPRTFQFFIQAQDGLGNDIYYNNGGLDYKVLFVKGGGGSQSSDGIKNLTLTIRHNGGEAFTQSFPAEGWQELVLKGQTTSLIVEKVEVEAEESVKDVSFSGTMYSTSQGGPSDEWRSFPLQNPGGGNWVLDMGEGEELVESKWLTENKTKTFQFFVQAKDGEGHDIYYNNGGEDYKVTFTTGEGGDDNWKVRFLEESTADLLFNLDGDWRSYSFNGDGSRTPEDQQLGQLSSLAIDQFALWFRCNNGVKTNDVSLQYRIYEEGQEMEVGWNRIDATQFIDQGNNTMLFYTDMMGVNVTDGLEQNKDYVLEAWYQVVVDGEYFTLCKDKESSKFKFSLKKNTSQAEIQSVLLTINHNDNGFFEVSFPRENMPALNLDGQTTSLKIMRIQVQTSGEMKSVEAVGTMYNTENGCPPSGDDWRPIGLIRVNDGYWEYDFGKTGYEIIEDEWLNDNKQKTFQFFVRGIDTQGNEIIYNNGGLDYQVNFTVGGSSDTNLIKSFKLTVNCDGETFTESFPSEGWYVHSIEKLVSSLQIMRAEVETDESIVSVGFCWTIYDTADGWQHDESAWGWKDLIGRGGGYWDYEWGKGLEFIESDWITDSKMKTLEFFAKAWDTNGNEYKFTNGINEYGYDNNYKVTFTTGIDPDGIQLIPASEANGATYNLAGQRVGKDYKGIVVTGGRKVVVR